MTRLFSFAASDQGPWTVTSQESVIGKPLPVARAPSVFIEATRPTNCLCVLRGITSNERYVERAERDVLVARQQGWKSG